MVDGPTRFVSRGRAHRALLSPARTRVLLERRPSRDDRGASAAVDLRLVGADGTSAMYGEDELPTEVAYYRGRDEPQATVALRALESVDAIRFQEQSGRSPNPGRDGDCLPACPNGYYVSVTVLCCGEKVQLGSARRIEACTIGHERSPSPAEACVPDAGCRDGLTCTAPPC